MKSKTHFFLAIAAAALLGSLAAPANAQTATTRVTNCSPTTPNNAVCLDWTAPATNEDGTPTVLPLKYRAQQRTGTAGTWANIASDLTVLRLYVQNLAPGDYQWRVFANCVGVGCIESNASNVVGKSATAPPVVPQAPVLIIAATIRAGQPPTFRIVYTVTPRADEYVFVAPASTRPVFAAR